MSFIFTSWTSGESLARSTVLFEVIGISHISYYRNRQVNTSLNKKNALNPSKDYNTHYGSPLKICKPQHYIIFAFCAYFLTISLLTDIPSNLIHHEADIRSSYIKCYLATKYRFLQDLAPLCIHPHRKLSYNSNFTINHLVTD